MSTPTPAPVPRDTTPTPVAGDSSAKDNAKAKKKTKKKQQQQKQRLQKQQQAAAATAAAAVSLPPGTALAADVTGMDHPRVDCDVFSSSAPLRWSHPTFGLMERRAVSFCTTPRTDKDLSDELPELEEELPELEEEPPASRGANAARPTPEATPFKPTGGGEGVGRDNTAAVVGGDADACGYITAPTHSHSPTLHFARRSVVVFPAKRTGNESAVVADNTAPAAVVDNERPKWPLSGGQMDRRNADFFFPVRPKHDGEDSWAVVAGPMSSGRPAEPAASFAFDATHLGRDSVVDFVPLGTADGNSSDDDLPALEDASDDELPALEDATPATRDATADSMVAADGAAGTDRVAAPAMTGSVATTPAMVGSADSWSTLGEVRGVAGTNKSEMLGGLGTVAAC